MKYFNFKRRNILSGSHLLGTILIFAGVFVLLSPMFLASQISLEKSLIVGATSVIIGLIIASTYGGTLIDFAENKVKEYHSISGYKIGSWTKLPAISTVSVISVSYFSRNIPNGISPTFSGTITEFRILLLSESLTPVLTFKYKNKNLAVDEAKQLATTLRATLQLKLSGDDGK